MQTCRLADDSSIHPDLWIIFQCADNITICRLADDILIHPDLWIIFQYADNITISRSADNIAICSTAPDNENVVQLRVFKSFATLSKAPRAIT